MQAPADTKHEVTGEPTNQVNVVGSKNVGAAMQVRAQCLKIMKSMRRTHENTTTVYPA